MEEYRVESVEDLEALLGNFGKDVLFRGQISHYGEPNLPSVVTSFDRNVCIPSEMLKWSRYAKNVLNTYLHGYGNQLEFTQALLQHYGWRSFYIDCSSNAAVSTWFASHKYIERCMVEMSEDYEERPVLLRKRMAEYRFEAGDGHLYVINKIAAKRVGLIDLAVLRIDKSRCRADTQEAWLVGPLRNIPLPADCFLAHVVADRAIFRDHAAQKGFKETNSLFPTPSEDPILSALLGLPWRELEGVRDDKFPIPAFRRALELPEYQESFVKIAWPQTAFFCGEKISEKFDALDGDPIGGIVMTVPNVALFGSASKSTPMRFPEIEKLVGEHGTVAFEIDELIQHSNMGLMTCYQKGVGVIPKEADLFEVCELMVEHPGLDMTKAGFNHGWFYRRSLDGSWVRETHAEECNCGSAEVHDAHISALHIIEAFLVDQEGF